MFRQLAQKFLTKILFFFWLFVTSPPLFVLVWLVQSHPDLRPYLSWLALPLVPGWLIGSWWLNLTLAHHMFDENQLFLTALKHTWYDLRLKLSFLPIIGAWFTLTEDDESSS
jgi:hypothetical protein